MATKWLPCHTVCNLNLYVHTCKRQEKDLYDIKADGSWLSTREHDRFDVVPFQ